MATVGHLLHNTAMESPSAAADALLTDLNDAQRRAAAYGAGSLLIVAGAGTGKTTTLAHRVAHLVARGVPPGRILLLTFTRRSARQMVDRVRDLIGDRVPPSEVRKIWGGTFHAISVRLLRRYGKQIRLDPAFSVMDRGDAEDLLNVLREELGLAKSKGAESGKRFPLKGTCLNIYSRSVNSQLPLNETLHEHFDWCEEYAEGLKKLFRAYVERKQQLQMLDYDDLLLFWRSLMASPVGKKVADMFDQVLVDEYQDTNILQCEILQKLRPAGTGITVVGDDAQSIYSFRAATVRNILDFPTQFSGPGQDGAEVIPLERNYRSTQSILDLSNEVMSAAKERLEKNLWTERTGGPKPRLIACHDEDEEADQLVETILERREEGIALEEQAVLFRASHHSLTLEVALARNDIPFVKYGGLRFSEAAHVKDALAFLKLAENPRDVVAGIRVLSLMPGFGPAKSRTMMLRLEEAAGDFTAWFRTKPPKDAADHWPLFVALMGALSQAQSNKLPTQLAQIRKFYEPLLRVKHDNPRQRLADLESLEAASSRYTTRMEFLTDLTLDPPQTSIDKEDLAKDGDCLTLSTIHSAKGLEWQAVMLMRASDGSIPSDLAAGSEAELEEERRLMYVALTRAKTHLDVTYARTFYKPGGFMPLNAEPSRFLQGPSIASLMDKIEASDANPSGGVWGDALGHWT